MHAYKLFFNSTMRDPKTVVIGPQDLVEISKS